MSEDFSYAIMQWHKLNGGHPGNPAGHVLKALEEMVELCMACGAPTIQIKATVERECAKQTRHGKDTAFNQGEACEELFDTIACLTILQAYCRLDLSQTGPQKLKTLFDRKWAVTSDGVLVRPERLKAWEEFRRIV